MELTIKNLNKFVVRHFEYLALSGLKPNSDKTVTNPSLKAGVSGYTSYWGFSPDGTASRSCSCYLLSIPMRLVLAYGLQLVNPWPLCDADDEVAPGWVAAMGEALSRYDFVACRIDIDKLNEPWVRKNRKCPQQDGIQKYDYPPYLPHAGGSAIGVKRRLHQAVGGFDESMILLEDTDYCWKIQRKSVEFHFVPDAVIYVRLRKSIKGIYRQAHGYGEYNVKIYKKYLPLGMPKLSWKQGVFSWKAFIMHFMKSIPSIRDKGDLAYWAWQFGWYIGRLKGSIKYRVFAL